MPAPHGPLFPPPRRSGRGAALTLVFASVLVAGAATGSFNESLGASRAAAQGTPTDDAGGPVAARQQEVTRAAARAMAEGTSPLEAAERAVSRSGDRWGAVYSPDEYEEFQESLDGEYTGVGLSAGRESDGRIEVTRVRPGSPAAAAGIRAGDRLRSVDGKRVDDRPVTEVVSILRGDTENGGGRDATAAPASPSASSATVTCGRRPCAGPGCPPRTSPRAGSPAGPP